MRNIAPVLLLTLLACPAAHAASFCVSNGAQLEAAIQDAIDNAQADEIRLRQGTYQRTGGSQFTLNVVDGQEILITGGWTGPNSTCTSLANDPRTTVIDAMGNGRGLSVYLGAGSNDLSLINLTFMGGEPNPQINYDTGTGVQINFSQGNSSDVLVERCIFRGNHADAGSGLTAGAGGVITVRNNLFIDNISDGQSAAAQLFGPVGGVHFVGNTVTGNIGLLALPDTGAVDIYGQGPHLLSNNIVVGNTSPLGASDVMLDDPTLAVGNLVGSLKGELDPASIDNFTADPRFVGNGDYSLRSDSPARDRGTLPFGGAGLFDVIGHTRVQGAAIDLGAFELEAVFRNGFENN